MSNPYDQYDNLQILQRHQKLCDDFETFLHVPRWMGEDVPFAKSQAAAEKIDKLTVECHARGLMERPYSEFLTDKGKEVLDKS